MELIDQLVSTLGVDENQAKGGAGLLFQLAKDKLGGDQFDQIASNVPGMDDLLQAAPSLGGDGDSGGGGGGLLSRVMSMFSGQSGGGGALASLGGLASLAGGFSQLGMDGGMVAQFLPVVMSFIQDKGGDQARELLESVLQ